MPDEELRLRPLGLVDEQDMPADDGGGRAEVADERRVFEGVVQRAQVRQDLLAKVARQKTQRLSGLDEF